MRKTTSLILSLSLMLTTGCDLKKITNTDSSKANTGSGQSMTVAEDLGDDFESIANRITPAVVSISTTAKMPNDTTHAPFRNPEQGNGGLGSGVIVDAEKGYVLTNHHVIEEASEIMVTLSSEKTYTAEVVGKDKPTDLAVLKIQRPPALTAAILGNSDDLKVGEWVLAIGSPFGLDSTVTAGIISAKSRAEVNVADFEDFLQTDAAINPGNSGGALVNIQGELIGINTAIATRSMGYMGIGFAIPSNLARRVMQELIEKGKVTRSQLGVYIDEIDSALRKGLGIKEDQQGILVADVIPDTPASEAGFEKYDVIISLNGKAVTQVQNFRNTIALTPPGQEVSIQVIRKGKPLRLTPTLRDADGRTLGNPVENALAERLGFNLEPLTTDIKKMLQLPTDFKGLAVTEIDPGSTAEQRGLKRGDIITEVNQQEVNSWIDVGKALESVQPGDAVLLNIVRQGQQQIMAFEMPGP